jgi:hypothetical protein
MEEGNNMNKLRIKELAEQAGLYFYVNGKLYPQSLTAEESCVAYEKFAELIAREIVSYAQDGDLDFMKFMIKKNFGIGESI